MVDETWRSKEVVDTIASNGGSMRGDIPPIVLSTTDSYEDCWEPFLTLVDFYWPSRPMIYLITESRQIEWQKVQFLRTFLPQGAQNWSTGLRRGLQMIDAPTILYMQDDYFLRDFVRATEFAWLAALFAESSADCLRLWEGNESGPWRQSSESPAVWDVLPESLYWVSLQAAFWKRSSLLALLRDGETPWQFETVGSGRAQSMSMRMTSVNRDVFRGPSRDIVPYKGTGVVRGQWNYSAVVELFQEHGIIVDFELRGFHKPPHTSWLRRLRSRGNA